MLKIHRTFPRLFKIIFFQTNVLPLAQGALSPKTEIQFPSFKDSSSFQELLLSRRAKAGLCAARSSAGSSEQGGEAPLRVSARTELLKSDFNIRCAPGYTFH